MSDTDFVAKQPLGVMKILGESFSLFFSNFVPMVIIALIPAVLGLILNTVLLGPDQQADLIVAGEDPEAAAAMMSQLYITIAISGIIGMVLWGFGAAAITSAAYDAKTGNAIDIGKCLRSAIGHIVPVVLCMIVGIIGIYVGLILLIIPGLILAAAWFVIIPAIVVENTGFGCFGRSAGLTKEYRWPLIGLMVLFFIIFFVISMVIGLVQVPLVLAGGVGFWALMIIQTIMGAFFYAVGGSMAALVYARLREIKEGATIQSLVDVFS